MTSSPIYDEQALLQAIAAGDEAAFTRLFQNYHHLLGHHIYRLTESREMAQEIVQDVFLKVWMIRESLPSVTHFRTWLFVISKNQALNAIRTVARQRIRHRQWVNDISPESDADTIDSSHLDLVDQAIEALPAQQKKVWLLSRREGLRYQEIADQMGLSHETVKYYMKLAIASIIRQIQEGSGLPVLLILLAYI